jgi:hypothetical protein
MLRWLAVASLLVLAGSIGAHADLGSQCCTAKLRAAGARERLLFHCQARAAARGTPVDAACVAAVGASLRRQFARVDAVGCPPADAGQVEADLERIVGAVTSMLRPQPTGSACAARKLKVVGRFAASLARAFATEAPYPADHLDVLQPATAGLFQGVQTTFAMLESGSPCLTTNDAAAVTAFVAAGTTSPVVPDGVFLTSMRVCPKCGDDVRGGPEQCDGFDALACNGPCRADCTCPVCGDGIIDQTTEACDGADDAACHGLCRPDCTCPPPVCGNGVRESGEQCDGADLGGCASPCQPDCTCAAVCGNGVVEPGEQCEGTTCLTDSYLASCAPPGSARGCQCCDGGICPILGCCEPTDVCLPAPDYHGICFPTQCRADHPCPFGFTCATDGGDSGICLANVGSVCTYLGFTFPCAPPAICPSPSSGSYCCLPSGAACTGSGQCCAGTSCTDGTCS